MDVTEVLVRAAPEPLRFPRALLDQDIRKSRVQPPLQYRFTPPVFLLQYAAPVLPRPPLTASYNALPETTQKRSTRVAPYLVAFSSSRGSYQCFGLWSMRTKIS